jgi:hypothetical protein
MFAQSKGWGERSANVDQCEPATKKQPVSIAVRSSSVHPSLRASSGFSCTAYPPSSFRVRAFTAMPVPRSLLVPVPVVLALYAAFQSGAFPARPQWKKQQAQRDFEKVSRLIDAGWGDKVLVIPL